MGLYITISTQWEICRLFLLGSYMQVDELGHFFHKRLFGFELSNVHVTLVHLARKLVPFDNVFHKTIIMRLRGPLQTSGPLTKHKDHGMTT